MSARAAGGTARAQPGRPKSYDRAVALERATDAFWSRGYSATSMRDLLEATGMVPKSLYAEFGPKDSIFVAAIDLYIMGNAARYREQLEVAPHGLDRIRRYYETFRGPPDRRGCLLVNSLAEITVIPAPAELRIRRFFRWLEGLYEANLAAAARAGALRPHTHRKQVASALVVFDQGLAIAARSDRRRGNLADAALGFLAALRA
jgi:TetR/AcrR family transcriptional repressor of nem operon